MEQLFMGDIWKGFAGAQYASTKPCLVLVHLTLQGLLHLQHLLHLLRPLKLLHLLVLEPPRDASVHRLSNKKSVRSKVSLKLSMSRSCCSSKFTLASWLQPILPPWNRCPAQFPSSCPAPPITPCSILPFLPPNHCTFKCLHLPCTEITLRSSPFIKTLPNTNFPHLAKNQC